MIRCVLLKVQLLPLISSPSFQKYPCFGFGAKLSQSGVAEHCFPLGDDATPDSYADGIEGIIGQYRDNVSNVVFSGQNDGLENYIHLFSLLNDF